MAKHDTLSCLQKRDILNRAAASTASLLGYGEGMERSGLLHDALSFYEKAGARDAIARLRDVAAQDGDLFLYRCACRALGEEPTPDQWAAVGRRAAELGKTSFAREAARLAGRDDFLSEGSSHATTPSEQNLP